jgi:hypothetical protein
LSFIRLVPYSMLCSVIFTEMPSEKILNALKADGYTVIKLPRNPYLP